MSRAEYMRAYRARKAALRPEPSREQAVRNGDHAACYARIGFLEAEVARLKRALAQANRDAILRKVNRSGTER
jgi:hypothetical protein